MTFGGFPSRAQATAIPNVFFSDVLPLLATDARAVGVTLYAFAALMGKRGYPRYITAAELAGDAGCAAYLAAVGAPVDAATIDAALRRARDAGVLASVTVETAAGTTDVYVLNAPADRRGLDAIRRREVDLGRIVEPVAHAGTRPGVFALYESLVGTLSPLVAEELAEAERLYPQEWLEAAFREAAAQNARSWRYVSRILERWAVEGPDHAKTERDPSGEERYFAGKYGRILKQRLDR